MIVATRELSGHRGRVTMVDGGFDPLHPGHVAYFEAACLRSFLVPAQSFVGFSVSLLNVS